ncbi:hypothetical protein I4U23_010759, partial [Adineta vaga]
DLKPENILLKEKGSSQIKIIDFGSGCFQSNKIYTYIQSRFYRAPEIILGIPYTCAIDMWSLACIIVELFIGYPIFPGENEQEQLEMIIEVFNIPPYDFIQQGTRKDLFFDSKGQPRCHSPKSVRKCRPGSRPLSHILRTNDFNCIDFLSRCFQWNSNERLTPLQGFIRYFDSLIDDKSKDLILINLLIIVSLTIVLTSILTILHLLNGFGNCLEDFPLNLSKYQRFYQSFPFLSLIDIFIGILILLPKILIDIQLIKHQFKDQSSIFESSIDFLFLNLMKRIKKDGISIIENDKSSIISCEIFHLFLQLIRFYFIYSNIYYKINKKFYFIQNIYLIISILFILFLYGTFEILFKQISLITNLYSYLLLISLFISILFILITNHSLFQFILFIYFQKQYQISNQLVRLSNIDDRYLITKPLTNNLIYYILFVLISVLCQFPLIIYSIKYLLFGLIDNLIIIYLIILLLFFFYSILIFIFLYYYPFNSWNINLIQENISQMSIDNQSTTSESVYKSNLNVEENLFEIESPNLIPTRTISSCGLTVIDSKDFNQRNAHPSFQQTPGVATDTLLVMH